MKNNDHKLTIDINSDMGEGYGTYHCGDDEAILKIVSSANVACGMHGGDPEIMANTFRMAKENGVVAGAHPGFPDLWGFGRRIIPFSAGQIERLVAYQIGAAQALSAYSGNPIRFVKTHGALGNLGFSDSEVAAAVCRAVKAVDDSLILLNIACGEQDRIAREMGLESRSEVFADRAYLANGALMPRNQPGAVLHDPEEAAARIVRMIQNQGVELTDGSFLPTKVDSVCVHSDTPGAVDMAAQVRERLVAAGVTIAPFV